MKRGLSAKSFQPDEILSSDEQDTIIRNLQEDLRKQDRCIRISFSVIFVVVAAIFAYCAAVSYVNPWNMIHQQRFEFTVPNIIFVSYYAVSVLNFGAASIICLVRALHVIIYYLLLLNDVVRDLVKL
jgi:hypothetical protein